MTARNTGIDTRGKPRIWNLFGERTRRNFFLQAAAGQIPGVSTFHVFGHDTDLGNSIKLIYPDPAIFEYPDEANPVQVVSSNNFDRYGNRLGAWAVRLVGLDYQYKIQTEDIFLNGVTSVGSIGDYRRILSAFIANAGRDAQRGPFGTITLTYSDGTHIGVLERPFNILQNSNFTVPADSNAYIYSYGFHLGAPKELFVGLRVSSPDFENPVWVMLDTRFTYGGVVDSNMQLPFMLTEKTDVEMVGYTEADSNTGISAYMDLLLIDKEYDWENIIRSGEKAGLEKVE